MKVDGAASWPGETPHSSEASASRLPSCCPLLQEHPRELSLGQPCQFPSHTCPEDLSPRPSLGQGQPQARLGGGGVPQAKVISQDGLGCLSSDQRPYPGQ